MRTDVKLGVVLALVMVLSAGGYFMFRGDKQTPISLADAAKDQPATDKAQSNKPVTPAKPGVNQPRTPATTSPRPGINPKSAANQPNNPTRPTAPTMGNSGQPTANPQPAAGLAEHKSPANTTTNTPATTSPATSPAMNPTLATNQPVNRPAPGTPSPNPLGNPASERPNDPGTSSPNTSPTTAPAVVTNQPVPSNTGMTAGLTGIPNSASPTSPNPDRPAGLSPLTNSPTAPGRTSSTTTALPPGIKTVTAPSTQPTPSKKENADAAVETHKVQAGDTLTSLAQTYYGDTRYAKFLADSNPKLTDPNRLRVGSTVSIPPLPADGDARTALNASPAIRNVENAANGKRTYTVKAGDSFYSIAKSQLGNASRWKELLALNSSTVNGDPTSLQPGQRLVLPES